MLLGDLALDPFCPQPQKPSAKPASRHPASAPLICRTWCPRLRRTSRVPVPMDNSRELTSWPRNGLTPGASRFVAPVKGNHPLLQEPLKIKDANEKPCFKPVAYRKQGFPTENPVLLLKNHTKAIQNPYKTHTKPYVCMLFIKPGFPAKNPVIFENL